jgi:hypothetical protein
MTLIHAERLECCSFRIAEKDRVDMFHDVTGNFQKAPLVLQRDQCALSPIIHSDLQWLDKRAHRFDVSLDAEISQDEHAAIGAAGIVNLNGRGMLVVSVARRLGAEGPFARLLCCPL